MGHQRYRYGGGGYGGGGPLNFFGGISPTVMYLIIANFVFFLFTMFAYDLIVGALALIPRDVFPGVQLWRPVTYMFLHHDFAHIFLNMLMLWWFGSPLEQIWGQKKFLKYYFITGIGAGLVCVPFYPPDAVIVGASGALFGILIAFALIYPNARVYLWFVLPIKVKYLVIAFAVIELTATMSYMGGETASRVASIAHLSGMVIGYFYLRGFMDIRAFLKRNKMKKARKAYRVLRDDDNDRDGGGPWLH
jgi:membrane associated rhomboid family serine protease